MCYNVQMPTVRRILIDITIAVGLSLLLPVTLSAQTVVIVNTGINRNIPQIIRGLVNVLLIWSSFVATAMFLMGAFTLAASHGAETWIETGKKLMKSAIIGYIIILGAFMIMSTVLYFIAG